MWKLNTWIAVLRLTWFQCHCLKNDDHVILQGTRCTSRCLQSYVSANDISQLKANHTRMFGKLWQENPLDQCIETRRCKECIKPCGMRFTNLEKCMDMCRSNMYCMYSCAFLSDINGKKMGLCSAPTAIKAPPGPNIVVHFQSASNASRCRKKCESDFTCKTNEKCCTFGCSSTCRPAFVRKSSVPPLLDKEYITISEQGRGSSVLLAWSTSEQQQKRSVMYIVQEQRHLSTGIPNKFDSSWQIITETSESMLTLVHLQRGYWYKFRVAAVNVNGTKGFTTLKQPFRLSAKPRRPPSPADLSQVALRITRGARYNIQVKWKLPEDEASDLPIKGFYVTWVQVSQSGFKIPNTITKRYVKASKSILLSGYTYWISWVFKLRFDALYNVSVVTSSGWKNRSLYSSEVDTRIQVRYPLERPKQEINDLAVELPFVIRNNTASANITWNFEFTEAPEKLVKFYVEWHAQKCLQEPADRSTNQELSNTLQFRLSGLRLGCEYVLTVQAMYGSFRHQWSVVKQLTFNTPPCGLNEPRIVIQDAQCPQSRPFQSAPQKFFVTGVVATPGGILSQLHWKPPIASDAISGQTLEVIGYFLYTFNNKNSNVLWVNIKPKKYPSWTLDNLDPNTLYICNVVAIFNGMNAGEKATAEATTGNSLPDESVAARNSQDIFYY